MKRLGMWLTLALVAGRAFAQANLPEYVIHSEAGPVDLRYVDFGWNPEAFDAMQAGGKHPAAGRSWMLALLTLRDPVVLEGSTLPVGASLLVLNPKSGKSPMTFEIRDVDLRVIFEPNVIGVPPKGEIVKVVPATWDRVAETKARLEIVATAAGRDTLVTIHYGDRKATLRFRPRGE